MKNNIDFQTHRAWASWAFNVTHALDQYSAHYAIELKKRCDNPSICSKKFFILFSGSLLHYGDRCVVDGVTVRTSLRSFQYIVEEEYTSDNSPKTVQLKKNMYVKEMIVKFVINIVRFFGEGEGFMRKEFG